MATGERDTIKHRVIKLLAVTTDRGATEAEAMAHAEKAVELMAHYDIEAAELNVKPAKAVMETVVCRRYGSTIIGGPVAHHVAQLCDCMYWCTTNADPRDADLPELWQRTVRTVVFFGLPEDAEVAGYLFDLISNAIVAEIDLYKTSPDYKREVSGRTAITSFVDGMEKAICARLDAMRDEKHLAVQQATGRSLVIVKEAQIKEDFAATGIKLTRRRGSYRGKGSASANASGRAAGDRVPLSVGVGARRPAGALR